MLSYFLNILSYNLFFFYNFFSPFYFITFYSSLNLHIIGPKLPKTPKSPFLDPSKCFTLTNVSQLTQLHYICVLSMSVRRVKSYESIYSCAGLFQSWGLVSLKPSWDDVCTDRNANNEHLKSPRPCSDQTNENHMHYCYSDFSSDEWHSFPY